MIGIIDQPIANAIAWKACPPIRWISERSRKRYLADPFPWPDASNILLCENFDYETQIGSIRKLELRDDCLVSETKENFPLPGHLSFPFLFAYGGAVYALPESSSARELSLFRWDPDKKGWKKIVSPLVGVPVADSILFEHGGHFWIAYTKCGKSADDNLHLIYAKDLQGPWIPHAGNPVVTGSSCSRCGGTPFRSNGSLFRPAQDCSKHYGGALRIMRIVECTPTSYREEEVAFIPPEGKENPHGLHTLSSWGPRCVVDGKRFIFSPVNVLKKACKRLKRICRKYLFRQGA
jgi:hypothetical protein